MKTKGEAVMITASKKDLKLFTCDVCDSETITSSASTFCPHCYSEFSKNSGTDVQLPMLASVKSRSMKCLSCDSILYTDSEDTVSLSASIYCPVCASEEVEPVDPDAELDDDVSEDEEIEVESCKVKASESEDTTEDEEDEPVPEDEEEIKEEIVGFEASFINSPEPTWVFFKNGNPSFKIRRSKLHSSIHPMFSDDNFVYSFQKRVDEVGVTASIKEFNAEVFEKENLIDSFDLEALAFQKLQASFVPKFIDCIALAIEGSVKGIYKDLNSELKAAFFDELVAAGTTETKALKAIEASFSSAGSEVFTGIVAKAMELINKPDSSLKEIKSTIQASGMLNISIEDVEKRELGAILTAGNVNIDTLGSLRDSGLKNVRDRIRFK